MDRPIRGRESLISVGTHRIQDKCGYPCLTLNASLRIAVCSAQDALLGIVSIYECPTSLGILTPVGTKGWTETKTNYSPV